MSWIELEQLPSWRRDTLLSKLSTERKAEKYINDKLKREMDRNKKKR